MPLLIKRTYPLCKGTVSLSMQCLIILALAIAVTGSNLPSSGYNAPRGGGQIISGVQSGGSGGYSSPSQVSIPLVRPSTGYSQPSRTRVPVPTYSGGQRPVQQRRCSGGLVLSANGSCVRARVSQNVYVFDAPRRSVSRGPRPVIPAPKIQRNVVFIRTSQFLRDNQPIVVPPTQQQTVVYVLSKNQAGGQQVIEIPDAPALTPEVYYVHYNEGQNPQLPGGINLQDALSNANVQTGQSIGGSFGGSGYGGSSGGSSGGFIGVDFDDSRESVGGSYQAPATRPVGGSYNTPSTRY